MELEKISILGASPIVSPIVSFRGFTKENLRRAA